MGSGLWVANGITLCTGSLGAGVQNDVPAIARRFATRIHFVHLRNVAKEPDGSFMEAEHLGGDTDLVAVVEAMLVGQARRREAGDPAWRLPFRPERRQGTASPPGSWRRAWPGTDWSPRRCRGTAWLPP